MKQGRILILGKDKESAYELRSLFDDERYELEIALTDAVAKTVLAERLMDLVIIDSQLVSANDFSLFDFLLDRDIRVRIVVVGPHAAGIAGGELQVEQLSTLETERPFPKEAILSYVKAL